MRATVQVPWLAGVQAVLLDMDGTLVDSDAAVERAWVTWSGEYGLDPADVLRVAHGSPADRTVRTVRPDLGDRAVSVAAQRQLTLQYTDLSDVVAAPGAHALLQVLGRRDLPWAVVTSADRVLAEARLGAAGIHAPVLVTVDDVTVGKPDPEGYLLAAGMVHAEPVRCLVVEDSEPGLVAGRAAGARTAALRGLDGDLAIRDLGELARQLSDAVPG